MMNIDLTYPRDLVGALINFKIITKLFGIHVRSNEECLGIILCRNLTLCNCFILLSLAMIDNSNLTVQHPVYEIFDCEVLYWCRRSDSIVLNRQVIFVSDKNLFLFLNCLISKKVTYFLLL